MFALFSVEILIGVTIIALIIGMIILLILQITSNARAGKLTYPVYEYVVRKAEHEADGIIEQAQKEARTIIVEAEKSGQETMQLYAESAKKAHDAFSESLDAYTSKLTGHLESASAKSISELQKVAEVTSSSMQQQQQTVSARFDEVLSSVQGVSETLESKALRAVDGMRQSIEQVEKSLIADIQARQTHQQEQIEQFLEKTLQSAEANIASYQKSRIALLDAHIEKLVEDVTRKVLHKQLTLDEHAELARLALVEAKENNLL